jgi:ABC-type phosphate transport system ATPase subunit
LADPTTFGRRETVVMACADAHAAIARACARRANLALDAASTTAVESLIAERIANGTSVVWSTHDNAQARRIGSRILAMSPDGGIKEDRA